MNSQKDVNSGYLAYLLRMWRKKDGSGKPIWCASLQEPGSGNIETFGEMSALFAFLQGRTGIEIPGFAHLNSQAPTTDGYPNEPLPQGSPES